MHDNIRQVLERWEQLDAQLAAPETYGDPALSARLLREQKAMEPLAAACRRCMALENDLTAARELGLGAGELAELRRELSEAERELTLLLLPRDENDERSVIMELRAGTGGEEAALFAADLYRMYGMYAAKRGWRTAVMNVNETELGGFKEIVFAVEGEGAWSRLKYEAGTHCVKRVPDTESSGRIQTSTVTVAVLPELEEVDFALDMKEVRIDVFRSSGAGGQKVNKTSSAIRVTHLPTNTVVECQDERSQYQNKDRALQLLRGKLWAAAHRKQTDAVAAARRDQVGTGERSEKIRTYFFLRGQAVEQRLEGEGRSFQLDDVLDGDLDPILDRLLAAERARLLKEER